MRKVFVVVILLLAVAGGVYYTLTSGQSKPSKVSEVNPTLPPITPQPDYGSQVIAGAGVLPLTSAELDLAATGIVSEVLVSEGDMVKKDQVLMRVDSKRQVAAVAQAHALVDRAMAAQSAAQAALARAQAALGLLKAPRRPEDIEAAAAAIAVAQAQLTRAKTGADTASLAAANANMDKAARAVQQAQYAYDRAKFSPDGANGPEALRLEQTTIDYNLAKTTYEQLQQGPRDVDVNILQAQLRQVQAQAAQAAAGPRPEAITAAEADVALSTSNVRSADADVASASAALHQADAALTDTELRAPFDGMVVTVNLKQGAAVSGGSFAVRLADLSRWKIQTNDLTELSVSHVNPGDSVSIRIDAIPDLALTGKVISIDNFGANRQGDIVYSVVIMPDKLDPRMRWNMTASVRIHTQ